MSIEKIKVVADQIVGRLPVVRGKGEEATKQALVLPMLDALGYDIWNPSEVCPEYDADFAIKKAGQKEKVDIALLLNNVPRVFIEVKQVELGLDGHEGQLARYFNATQTVTLGVLTNGIEWRFFTDTGDPNVMDSQPFHIARVDTVDQGLDVVARFAKAVFSPEAIRDYATELRYTTQIAAFLRAEIDLKEKEPSEYFVRWILKSDKMYDGGVVNGNVVERFKPIVKAGLPKIGFSADPGRFRQPNAPRASSQVFPVAVARPATSQSFSNLILTGLWFRTFCSIPPPTGVLPRGQCEAWPGPSPGERRSVIRSARRLRRRRAGLRVRGSGGCRGSGQSAEFVSSADSCGHCFGRCNRPLRKHLPGRLVVGLLHLHGEQRRLPGLRDCALSRHRFDNCPEMRRHVFGPVAGIVEACDDPIVNLGFCPGSNASQDPFQDHQNHQGQGHVVGCHPFRHDLPP